MVRQHVQQRRQNLEGGQGCKKEELVGYESESVFQRLEFTFMVDIVIKGSVRHENREFCIVSINT